MARESGDPVRFLFRVFKVCLAGACLVALAVVAGIALVLEETPAVDAAAPPAPEDVVAARQFVRDVRTAASDSGQASEALVATTEQLNSVIRLTGRFADGFRGRIALDTHAVMGRASLPLPWWGGEKWLNLTGEVPAFDGAFRLSRVTVGPYEVPPDLALFVMRTGANLVIGNQFGDRVLQSASAMRIDGDTLRFDLGLDRVGQNGVMRDAFGSIRGQTMPSPDEIETYHLLIREAMEEGTLPASGSFAIYLSFALETALARSTELTLANEYTAAVFGLAKACGALDFAMIVGRLAFDATDDTREWRSSCEQITLNGRIDSRRHFITSAALQAASNRGVSVSLGEFKELYDAVSGAGGFDFTDMAANLSGVRLSNVLMSLPRDAWPARLSLLETESDVIVSFDGIPHLMSGEEFAARYDDIESAAYKAMLSQIEARIDRLGLYRGL